MAQILPVDRRCIVPELRLPNIEGKVIAVTYGSGERDYAYLHDPKLEMQADRLFLTGQIVDFSTHDKVDISAYVAWDSVTQYYVFDSIDHCRQVTEKWQKAGKSSWFRRT